MMFRLPQRTLAPLLMVGAALALVPGYVMAQTFSAQIAPNPVRLVSGGAARSVTVSTTVSGGFAADIFYSFSGFPAGISTGGTLVVVDPYGPVSFSFSAASSVPRGTYSGSLTGSTPDATVIRTFPMTVVVEKPDFALSVSPSVVSVTPGGAAPVTVQATPIDGFNGTVSVVAPSLPGISFSPSAFDLPASGSQTVVVSAAPTASQGGIIGAFVGSSSSVSGKRAASLTVRVGGTPPPPPPTADFSLSVSPASLSLSPGETGMLEVSALGSGGISESVTVSSTLGPGLSVQPADFALIVGGKQAVVVSVSETAAPGPTTVAFSGTATGIPGARTAMATVVVTAASAPVIRSITPPSVVTGTTGNVLRVTGENFSPGAVISSGSPGVQVTAARILGPGSAEIAIAVRPDAPPGPYRLDLRNPDGGMASGGAMLLVYPAGALSAPVAVTAAAIVYPRPWQMLQPDQGVHARGLLATSGMGTVVGTWLLDGVPFDRFTRIVTGGFPVEVRSTIPIPLSFTGEHRLELAIESPQSLPPQAVPFFQSIESRSDLKILAPEAGAILDPDDPVFRWTLVPGASGYEVEIQDTGESHSRERPWTAIRRRTADTEWRPEETLLRALGAGIKRFRVRAVFPGEVLGDPTAWLSVVFPEDGGAPDGLEETGVGNAPFRLVSTLAAPRGDPGPGSGPDGSQEATATGGQLGLSLMSTTSTIASDFEDPPPLTRLQLSTQTDVRGSLFDQQATADLSGSQDIEDPWNAREESRAWLTRLGATEGGFRQEATLGFAPPSFFDQTEFLTVATAGGGVEGSFGSPVGSLSYYRSLDLSANGGFGSVELDIDAAAYEATDDAGRFLFRTMWLQVGDPAVEGFAPGGEGKALGVIGVANLGPRLRILGEAVGGEFDPAEGSFEEARDGKAYRLALDGTAGTFGYGFLVGLTGEGFVNPANRGFTPGGVSDRTRAELSLSKYFGQAFLSGRYSHVRGGIAEGAADPGTTENGAGLLFSLPLGQRVTLSTGGNLTTQQGDALDEIGLPETDRTQKGLDLSVTELLGPVSLSQTLAWQDFTDRIQPILDQQVTTVSLAASGALAPAVSLSANVSNTRTRAAPEIGTTDQLLVSLQPAFTLQKAWLSFTPRAAWTRVANDLDDSEFKTDQYQLVLRWSPPWAGALLNFEAASDWNRSWSGLDPEPPSFDRQTVLTLSFNWRFDRAWAGSAASDPNPPQIALVNHGRQEEFE
ncbi:MAG: hypothetical protein ACREK5_07055 [Gemmatimonadota bacterium]